MLLASRRDEKRADVYLQVMRYIERNPEMSTRQIADLVGISNGSAYYVLKSLIEKGFVKLENFKQNPRKAQYAYLLTPSGIREKSSLARGFIKRKRQEYADLKNEIEALEQEVELLDSKHSGWK